MKVQSDMSGPGLRFQLTRAILIYSRQSQSDVSSIGHQAAANLLCSVHDVRQDLKEQRPVVGPGQLLDRASVENLVKDLVSGRKQGRKLVPERLLYVDLMQLIWWSPARRETIYFSTADKEFNKDVTGQVVAHPPLLFSATTSGLRVFALGESKRPDVQTPVFVAPYCNLYASGAMCRGDVKLPGIIEPEQIPEWESVFFDSRFTHSNLAGTVQMTQHEGGHNALWREMRDWAEFPSKYLTPTALSVDDILNGRTSASS